MLASLVAAPKVAPEPEALPISGVAIMRAWREKGHTFYRSPQFNIGRDLLRASVAAAGNEPSEGSREMISAYQTDVRTLSDEDLKLLSEEIESECHRCCRDDDWWTDDEAETRYYQMVTEIRRRWEIANPEEAAKRRKATQWMESYFQSILGNTGLAANAANVERAADIQFAEGTQWPTKIGSTLAIRRPERFRANSGDVTM